MIFKLSKRHPGDSLMLPKGKDRAVDTLCTYRNVSIWGKFKGRDANCSNCALESNVKKLILFGIKDLKIMEDQPKKRKGKKPGPKPGSKYRHGGYSLLTRGVLPQRRRYIGHYLTEIKEGLIHDLAKSEEDLSTAQKVLIDRIVTFLGRIRLIEEHAKQHGVLDSRGRPTSGLTGHYLTFNRQVKEMLALLGVQKREIDQGYDLTAFIEKKAGERGKI